MRQIYEKLSFWYMVCVLIDRFTKQTSMKKTFSLLTVALLISVQGFSQAKKINWITLEEAFAKVQTEPRKVIVDVYTDWCGWCKVMDQKTFTDPKVVDYVNKNYYAVKFDAETKKDVKIGDTVYKFDAANRANQAAVALLQGKMSYPSIVYLDEKFNMIQPIPGYMEAKPFHQIITFIGGNHHTKEQFEAFKTGTYVKTYGGK
jgi:thioredoxin-related protein